MENQIPLNCSFGQVRDARASDVNEILRMVARLAAHHGDESALSAEVLARDVFCPSPWIYVLVAEAETGLIGYAALCGLTRLGLGQRGFDLHHLFTEEPHRGQGVGINLVDACIRKSKAFGCSYLVVGTHPDNLDAQAYYLSRGFKRRDAFPPRFIMQLEG